MDTVFCNASQSNRSGQCCSCHCGPALCLNDRMRAAGMMTVDEMMGKTPLDKFHANAGVTDLDSFEKWVESKRREFLRMQATMDLAKNKDSELYEWVIAHAAAFGSVMVNFRQAMERTVLASPAVERHTQQSR